MSARRRLAAAALAALALAALVPAAGAATCPPWEPASAPYQGDPVAAVKRLPIAPDDKALLVMMVGQGFGGVRAYSGPAGVEGRSLNLANRRFMNGAGGRVCEGATNYSRFPAGRREVGWVYVAGRSAVIVYDSCGNVELADNLNALPPPPEPSRQALRAAQAARQGSSLAALLAPGAAHQVPEPGTLALLALAALAAWPACRRRAGGAPHNSLESRDAP